MKILFISSGNSKEGISPIVKRQGESLIKQGLEIQFFTIIGKGFNGYLGNLKRLKDSIKEICPDIIHAHYSLSAYLATLARAKPLVVSLMGSDVKSSRLARIVTYVLSMIYWRHIIVKSEDMQKNMKIASLTVIPNGVDMDIFTPLDKMDSQNKIGWDINKQHILFAANPSRPEKNYILANEAFILLNDKQAELHSLSSVPNGQVPIWINAADVVILTSLWEGSPNVIKEAMACNRPIVATNVGDIAWLFGDTEGCYLTLFDPKDVAEKIQHALQFSRSKGKTNGRQRIEALGLDSVTIANKIIDVYKKTINETHKSNKFNAKFI